VTAIVLALLALAACVSLFLHVNRSGTAAPPTVCHHNCRFWSITAEAVAGDVSQAHLIDLPFSLEALSVANDEGWSIVSFDGRRQGRTPEPEVRRGERAAHEDPLYDLAVADVVTAEPQLAVAHVRNCSSGLCNIPNPHPFERVKNDVHWFMGHNGVIDLDLLLYAIRPEYLADNPPQYGDGPDEWIDSELYFLFLLQTLEDHDWQVKPALGAAIQRLRNLIPGSAEALNMFLTDGESVWAYREGDTLFHLYVDGPQPYSVIASRFPTADLGDWTEMSDGQLITLEQVGPPLIENIELYFDLVPVGDDDTPGLATTAPAVTAAPNPFNAATTLHYELPGAAVATLRIYGATGRLVRALVPAQFQEAGRHTAVWKGLDQRGAQVASGTYFGCLYLDGRRAGSTVKLTLLK